MTPTYHYADVEPFLRRGLPRFAAYLDDRRAAWDPDDDAEYIAYSVLDDLRLWLLEQRAPWRRRHVVTAFDAIEQLCLHGDDHVQGALAVSLLEGHWPRAHMAAMGPATRHVRDLAERPAWRNGEPPR
jgi:hypothetical protein